MPDEKVVSMKEAEEYITKKRKKAPIIANAVFLCIVSPILLIILGTMAEEYIYGVSEKLAAIVGLIFLFAAIAVAVYMFIICGIDNAYTEDIENGCFDITPDVFEMVKARQKEYLPAFAKGISAGVVLCIMSVVPIIIAGIMEASDFICAVFVVLLLLMVAIGVNIIIRVSIIKSAYDALLQEGEYTKKEKNVKEKSDAISGFYWCLVTAGYLIWSFITKQWDYTWIVWPVAGLLFGAFMCLLRLFGKLDDE